MAIQPGTYNFTLQRRSDHTIPLLFKDGNDAAINLTGYTVEAQVYDESRSTKYADWAITYTDRGNGIIDMNLADTDTANFTPDILFYDVLLTEPSGSKNYYLEGKLFISEGYTA